MGEILSSILVHNYMRETGAPSHWLDARTCIATDSSFREGKVNWPQTAVTIQKLKPVLADHIIITQGFIGRTDAGLTTTLGREGSTFRRPSLPRRWTPSLLPYGKMCRA